MAHESTLSEDLEGSSFAHEGHIDMSAWHSTDPRTCSEYGVASGKMALTIKGSRPQARAMLRVRFV